MRIIIDGDACPVKEIIIEEAIAVPIPVLMISSYSHYTYREFPDQVQHIYVESSAEATDFKILQLATSSDIVVTQDYGLASLLLAKQGRILHHRGFEYTHHNIQSLLSRRYLNAKIRQKGGRTKGPSSLTNNEKERFRQLLQSCIDDLTVE